MKRRLIIGIVGILVAVTITSIVVFDSNILAFLSGMQQSNHGRESFTLSAGYYLNPIEVTRKLQLKSGQNLKGNYTFSMLNPQGVAPNGMPYILNYETSLAIMDSQNRALALYSEPSGNIMLLVSSSDTYSIIFGCTTVRTDMLPATLNVTWAYNING